MIFSGSAGDLSRRSKRALGEPMIAQGDAAGEWQTVQFVVL
jgi:hypothetical protein